jgi:hypothetical protein
MTAAPQTADRFGRDAILGLARQTLAQKLINPAPLQSLSNNFALYSPRRLGATNDTPEGAPFQTTPIR